MPVSSKIKDKLQQLPRKPGVYLMRDREGRIIYIGKANSLRNRVQNYFRRGTLRGADPKLRGLIESVDDLEFIVVRNEAEAILTEGKLIKEYRPRFNIMLRDDKRFLLIRVDEREPWPRFRTCRIKKEDGARYFGPYASSASAREAIGFCEKTFGLRACRPRVPDEQDYRHCLNDIIRFCTAPCMGRISREDYIERVRDAVSFLEGGRPDLLDKLEEQMQTAAAEQDFERAAALRDTLLLLRKAIRTRVRNVAGPDMKAEQAQQGVEELQQVLQLDQPPTVIECFDISNISGTYSVASMVCAVNGLPRRNRYRLFRIQTVEGIDDPMMMKEAVGRRCRRLLEEKGERPGLIIVDGGITQLRAAQQALNELGIPDQPLAGLAKQFEEIVYEQKDHKTPIRLSADSEALKVLQRIRDEAHRFALTYHRRLRHQRITESMLDEIEGVGDKRKQRLLSHFGSMRRIRNASIEDLTRVEGVGQRFAEQIYEALHPRK